MTTTDDLGAEFSLEVESIRTTPTSAPATNRGNLLLEALDAAAWRALEPYLERTTFGVGEVFLQKGKRAAHVIFPISGAISLEADAGEQRLQVALIGRESMIGMSLLLGGVSPNHAISQFAGTAWRIDADIFAACLARHPELHRQMLRGVNAYIVELSQGALACGRGTIEQRLARWLLTASQRLDSDVLIVTHEGLAEALGVRRAGITTALHVLEGKHALQSERRRVRILDRKLLAATAGPYQPPHSPKGT